MPEIKQLSDYYTSIVAYFDNHLRRKNQLSDRVRKTTLSYVRKFCEHQQSIGKKSFSDLCLRDVNMYIVQFGKTHDTMHPMISALKKLNAFIKESEIFCVDFGGVIIARPAARRKLLPVFTADDVEKILSVIKSQNRPSVKRDTAIVELAVSTGLRAVDIARLKLADIDWNTNEIRLIQSKTGHGLSLPLEAKAGNAIVEYILHERPQDADCPQVFLTLDKPFRKLQTGSIGQHISTYISQADVGYVPGSKMGFHSFRRYVATQMIDNDVELDTVREFLGQKQINSLKPYIRVSKGKLSTCALGFEYIPVLQEELV